MPSASATASPKPASTEPAVSTLTVAAADAVVLVAHPRMAQSRANRQIVEQSRALSAAGPMSNGARLQVRDLYALYPDFLIDVAAEQTLLRGAQLIVWQFPVQWYAAPPLLKLWVDEVFSYGWAYGPGGSALQGKDLWLVTTTGGPEDSYRPDRYNRYFFDAFLPPFEQTAALCGMRFLPPLVLHGAHQVSHSELQAHTQVVLDRLASYPHWPELDDLPVCASCAVPLAERPV
jgi:glutathione-regulated potassium-efflux system ancillary protein KefF